MPRPMLYPCAVTIRVERDVPDRMAALRQPGEGIAAVQRRVLAAGLRALEPGAPEKPSEMGGPKE